MALAVTACRENPFLADWNTPYGIPPFDKVEEADYLPAIKAGIKQQNDEIEAIISCPDAPDFENTIAAFDRSGLILERVNGVLFNVSESDATPSLNDIVDKAMPMVVDHQTDIFMNEALYARVKAVYESDQSSLTGEQKMIVKEMYEAFESNGIGLDPAGRERLKQINSELSSLALSFGNNLLDESNAFKAEFGFSVANYYDKMASIEDRALREKIFKGYSMRAHNGGEKDNQSNILRIMELRIERAKLLGYDTPAAEILHDKMAAQPEAVDGFLSIIMAAAMKHASAEVAEMQKIMDGDIAAGLLPEGSKIEPWDYMYYLERLRKATIDFDETEVMQYFKMENVRAGVFANATRLYGIQFEPLTDVALYNPECEAFKVTDADGSLIGVIITDYYPRDSKRAGAWMNNFISQCEGVRPVIVNVGNFNKPDGDKPALLNIDQVETMFHEFGHALHGLLSQCRYKYLSGTSVKRDFVELPSQINENWAFEPEVLATYAFHWQTGEPIPAELVAKVQAAANFGQGFSTGELCAASILDMKWHELSSVEGVDVDSFEKKACEEMGLIAEIIPRYRSTYFNHIFGSSGYSAGYYSYLWAEVLDKDAFELFRSRGVFDKETAMSFRRNILEKGGSEDPMKLYVDFAGHMPDSRAMLRARGLL